MDAAHRSRERTAAKKKDTTMSQMTSLVNAENACIRPSPRVSGLVQSRTLAASVKGGVRYVAP